MISSPPRTAKKKRPSKRLSAPPKSLANDLKIAQPTMQTINSEQTITNNHNNNNNNANDNILDLFDFNDGNNQKQDDINNKNNNNESDDFFDLFDDNPPNTSNALNGSNGNGMNNNHNNYSKVNNQQRNTINTLQIHPNLMNPRESRSLQPDKLFDVSMWQSFDSNDKKNNNINNGINNNNNNNQNKKNQTRNTTLNFEPININKKKDEDEEESEEDEEDEDEDEESDEDDKKKQSSTTLSKRAPSKPRASAPPTTLSSTMKNNKDKDKDKEKEKEKETNALEELHRGAALLKYPRRSGFPHFKHIQLSSDNLRIEWFSKRKNLSQTCIYIKDIREVVRGQETEVFKKFHQKTLEKSSFSIVYGHSYKTLDVAAKSIDECEMWVKCILKLCEIYKRNKRESDLISLREIFVGIHFKDRNRPMSRQGSGNFIRANSSKNLKIDPVALKEIERDMESLHKSYFKTAQLAQKPVITKSNQYSNIQYVLSELEERIEELTYEVANIRDTELAKREVWRANVDLSAIQEKVEVLLKHLNSKSDRRKSNFL